MEITYSQNFSYSLTLTPKLIRDLADHLDITVKELKQLVRDEELFNEHGDALREWIGDHGDDAEATQHDDIEIEDIILPE